MGGIWTERDTEVPPTELEFRICVCTMLPGLVGVGLAIPEPDGQYIEIWPTFAEGDPENEKGYFEAGEIVSELQHAMGFLERPLTSVELLELATQVESMMALQGIETPGEETFEAFKYFAGVTREAAREAAEG